MRRVLACLLYLLLPLAARSEELTFPDGTPMTHHGGLLFVRQGDQCAFSFGGAVFPRKIGVVTHTPAGPVITRFALPAGSPSPLARPLAEVSSASAFLWVEVPDPDGLLYVEGQLLRTHGKVRCLQSPPLFPGQVQAIQLRSAFATAAAVVIEKRVVLLRAGENVRVTFDGSQAVAIPVRWDTGEVGKLPSNSKD